ncbi:hypothetical protein [Lacihabitans soyangensis]|uniref:Uncharacterized protein n=1 Tax=Lacihabitans soyangensis TaxID=869394 RepID=A0AAE3H5Z5_9BACT|nr:hypothetical protein [Lacihabitans soyangensis]MCP9764666.1 hypothetical protein [Lacihabitans soyangensis]
MKRVVLSLIVTFTFSSLWANTEFEKTISDKEFEKIQKIEAFIEANPEVTLAELQKSNSELLSNVELLDETSTTNLNAVKDMPLLGGFWWGCCLGVIGLALVYFITDNDRDQVKKAFIGCLIATLFLGIGGLINPFGW